MKQIMLGVCLFISIFFISGCVSKTSLDYLDFKDDSGYFNKEEVTYKFTGLSNHFGFETGKVYYGENNERYILMSNFKIVNKIPNQDKIKEYRITLKFNDEDLISDDMILLDDKSFEDTIKSFKVEENGMYYPDGYGETDAFIKTNKDNFKDSITLEIKYCYKDDKCKIEKLKIKYF